MAQKPAVRLHALCVFAFLNILFGWVWWQVIQVEKHPIPDICSFPHISTLFFTSSKVVEEPLARASPVLDVPSTTKRGSCTVSSSVLRQRRQWRMQLEMHFSSNPLSCRAESASAPVEDLQWTTLLEVVPLCADAEPAAQRVYRQLAAIGGADEPATIMSGQCTIVPVQSLLAAAGRETATVSGSSNGLLVIRMSFGASHSSSCVLPDAGADLDLGGAAAAYLANVETEHVEPPVGDPQALARLRLFVSSSRGKADGIHFHISAGSSMLLVIPRESNEANESLSSQTAAEAVAQVLGRWVLSPAAFSTDVDAAWRVRLWLLGDGNDAATVNGNGAETTFHMHALAETSANEVATHTSWDVGEILRVYLHGFFEALSILVDLSFTSQVVPHSGLEELDWEHLVPLALAASGEAHQRDRGENFVLEEVERRIINLQEEWDSDQEHYHSSRDVNLSLYKPTFPMNLPEGFALALPFWGFLTIGSSVRQRSSGKENAGKPDTSFFRLDNAEATAISNTWIAQLRSLLGLNPGVALTTRKTTSPCKVEVQAGVCGKECKKQRCLWHVQTVAPRESSPALNKRLTSDFAASTADFSMRLSRAMLVSGSGDAVRRVEVYLQPSRRGLTEWDLGGLAADFHFSMIVQAAENIRTLHEIIMNHHDIRVPRHVGKAIQHVMHQLECSIEALRMRPCASLPAAAMELLKHEGAGVCDIRDVGRCASSASSSKQEDATMYRNLALLLARSALKDSKELLADGSMEPAPFFSQHFNLAILVPLILPFVLPTLASVIRAAKAKFCKQV